jgi:hypothetical protein
MSRIPSARAVVPAQFPVGGRSKSGGGVQEGPRAQNPKTALPGKVKELIRDWRRGRRSRAATAILLPHPGRQGSTRHLRRAGAWPCWPPHRPVAGARSLNGKPDRRGAVPRRVRQARRQRPRRQRDKPKHRREGGGRRQRDHRDIEGDARLRARLLQRATPRFALGPAWKGLQGAVALADDRSRPSTRSSSALAVASQNPLPVLASSRHTELRAPERRHQTPRSRRRWPWRRPTRLLEQPTSSAR